MQTKNFNSRAAAELLTDTDTFAFTLISIALYKYKDELFEESGEVIIDKLEQDFNVKIPEENQNKINAALLAMISDAFFTKVPIFNSITKALADGDIDDIVEGSLEDISGCDIMWALYEISILRDENMDELEYSFTQEVSSYVEAIIGDEAVDEEELQDDVDTLAEALAAPYFITYIKECRRDLAAQLSSLGFSKAVIKEYLEDSSIN